MLTDALAAEWFLIRRRVMTYVLGGAWALMVMAFAFVVPYLVYLSLSPQEEGREELLGVVLPGNVDHTSLSAYPLFGGAIMLVLGVLITGSEDRWNTWKVRFTQGPSRAQVLVAKYVTGAVIAAAIAALALAAGAATAAVIAAIAGEPVRFPGLGALALSLGSAALIAAAWCSLGMTLGVLFKGTTTAIAVGLIWTLALENTIAGLAGMLPALEPVRHVLLGTASGSLVAATGAPIQGDGGTPGVVDVLSGPVAIIVLLAYAVVGAVLSTMVMRRRDIT